MRGSGIGAVSRVGAVVRRRPWVVLALSVTLVVSGVVAVVRPWESVSTDAECSGASASSVAAASELAIACDVEVEVIEERSPWVTVFARPDGQSRMTVDAVPVRTNANGEWEPVDVRVRGRHRAPQPQLRRKRRIKGSVRAWLREGVDRPESR